MKEQIRSIKTGFETIFFTLSRSKLLNSFEEVTPATSSEKQPSGQIPKPGTQLCFFADDSNPGPKIPKHLSKIEEEIKKIDILTLTPLDAFQKLHKLKSFTALQYNPSFLSSKSPPSPTITK